LFVAVWPPAEVLDRIEALDRPGADGVRWTRRDQWHVTLRFLGEADEAASADALARVVGDRTEAVVGPRVERLGRGVLHLPVVGLDEVATAVIAATAGVGQPPEDRPFRGHLTLARVKRRPPRGYVGTPFSARFAVDEVCLVRSADGAYDTISRRQLSGSDS